MKIIPGIIFACAAILICVSMLPPSLKAPKVDEPAPDFEAVDQDGVKFKLSDYRGKVTVVDFWGEWCSTCVELIPHNKAIVEKFKDKPFALIGVNSDGDQATANQVLRKEGITYRNAIDGSTKGPIDDLYGVDGWPTILVLDRKGVVRHRYVGVDPEELTLAIEQELARR